MDTGVYLEKKYLEKKGWIQGYILGITDLEFENHKNVKKCIFRTMLKCDLRSKGVGEKISRQRRDLKC